MAEKGVPRPFALAGRKKETPPHDGAALWFLRLSKLADLVLDGHPDAEGKHRVTVDPPDRQRIFTWIDLNVPYYGTSSANNYDIKGCRQIVPKDLDEILRDVAGRRCISFHGDPKDRQDTFVYTDGKIHRKIWTRITNPRLNNFLLAPLAKAAGGTEACGAPIFKTKNDPDYQALLKSFDPVRAMIRQRPRVDMMAQPETKEIGALSVPPARQPYSVQRSRPDSVLRFGRSSEYR